MEPFSYTKPSFKTILIDHNIIDFEYHYDIHLSNKLKIDENEKKLFDFISDEKESKIGPYYGQKEIYNFLNSKLKVMEKMNLNDECCFEGKIETRKINVDKNVFPKSKQSKSTNCSNSPRKKINIKSHSPKKFWNKNNKFIIIDVNGKIEKSKNFEKDEVNDANSNSKKKRKEKEMLNFFSDKTLLDSIINEMKDK